MSATTWSPLSIRGVSPQGGAWSRTHPPHRQAEPASALCASPPRRLPPSRRHGACLPLPRGSDPAPGNTALFPLRAGRGRVCGDSAMGLRSTRPWICRCVLSCRAPLIPFLLHASLGSPSFPGACLHHPAREPPPRRGRPPAPRPGPRQDLLLL